MGTLVWHAESKLFENLRVNYFPDSSRNFLKGSFRYFFRMYEEEYTKIFLQQLFRKFHQIFFISFQEFPEHFIQKVFLETLSRVLQGFHIHLHSFKNSFRNFLIFCDCSSNFSRNSTGIFLQIYPLRYYRYYRYFFFQELL